MRSGKGDRKKAILFYEMNNIVSESFFGVIRGFEIAFRNSVHAVMTKEVGHADWYDRLGFLGQREMGSIANAKVAVGKGGKPVIPSRVIAELSMGFWCGLCSRAYDSRLWVPHLHKAFPHKNVGRKNAWNRLEQIRLIRNRIAHHECILEYRLSEEYTKVLEITGWICPITARWVRHTSTLEKRLQDLATLIASTMTATIQVASTGATAPTTSV